MPATPPLKLPTLEEPWMKRPVVLLTVLAGVATSLPASPAGAAALDGTCVASVALHFSPPASQPLPLAPAPAATVTGTGTIATCVLPGGGPTTGTFSYALAGNLTCTSAENVTGTLDITWADASDTHATVSGLLSAGSIGGAAGLSASVISGRFSGDQVVIANLRDPLALLTCLTSGLSQAGGTTSLTFTRPLLRRHGRARRARQDLAAGVRRKLSASPRPSTAQRPRIQARRTR
jgi:hypothetical protein